MKEPFEPPKRAGSVLERLGGRSTSDKADEDDSVRKSFGGNRNREDDLMLDVRLKDGTRCALAYGTLMKIFFSPADQLKLAFASGIVVSEGRRLITRLMSLIFEINGFYLDLRKVGGGPTNIDHFTSESFVDGIHFCLLELLNV